MTPFSTMNRETAESDDVLYASSACVPVVCCRWASQVPSSA